MGNKPIIMHYSTGVCYRINDFIPVTYGYHGQHTICEKIQNRPKKISDNLNEECMYLTK